MAPPSIRRTGFSKRAQYSNFFGLIAAVVGALVGVGLLILSIANPAAFASLRGMAADAVSPVGSVVAVGKDESKGLASSIGGFFMSGSQNARLEKEAQLARVRLAEADAMRDENRRLKALLGLPQDEVKPLGYARLIGSTAGSVRRFATLSIGSRSGVSVGMPVRSPMGLVGRVLEVSGASSRVLLITDSESTVPVRRASDGVAAFAQGRGDGTIELRLVSLGVNPLHAGDVFVTSGSGGLYRPGVAVAVVQTVTHDGGVARVLSDPSSSEFVTVEQVFMPGMDAPHAETPGKAPR